MGMWKSFCRFRRTRGFGVHSPFAFRFITEVLGERLPYYDYSRLPSRTDRALYRITCRFSPRRIGAAGGADLQPAAMACPGAVKSRLDLCDMIVASGDCIEALLPAIEKGCVVVLRSSGREMLPQIRAFLAQKDCGMTFDNTHDMAVVVPDPKLPRQDFDVNF